MLSIKPSQTRIKRDIMKLAEFIDPKEDGFTGGGCSKCGHGRSVDIENQEDGEPPNEDVDDEGDVGEDNLFRGLAVALDLDEVEVAEDAVDDEGDGEHHDVVLREVGGKRGVEAVGHDGDGQDDGD